MPSVLMEGISKYYPSSGVSANVEASLRVDDREIHALVGENGAGKTTLMRVLYGLEAPDQGSIRIQDRIVDIASPLVANGLGIGMVHQHFTTIPAFTVAENVVLGDEPRNAGLFFDRKRAERDVGAVIAENGFHISPSAPAASLTVGERQQLEIVKLLYRKAEILILDEPTAVLTEQEIQGLFKTLRSLREAGKTIVIITHKVREVKEIADSVTVMRHGRTVARVETATVDESGIACLMMGTTSCADFDRNSNPAKAGGTVFELRNVSYRRRGRTSPDVDGVDLAVRSGEVLGLCGVVGNGLGELENLVSGLAAPTSGEVLLEGKSLCSRRTPRLGYVPADRMGRGACLESSVLENLSSLDRRRFFPRGIADLRASRIFAEEAISRFSIAAKPEERMGALSGGTMQKVILARELAGEAPFLIFSNPTWGLDIASTEFVYERMAAAKSRGAGILLVSANLDEILTLSDRIAVMYKGRIVHLSRNGPDVTRESLGEYMLGLKNDDMRPLGPAAAGTAVEGLKEGEDGRA
jgi:simple sugar transport system ATP-binding protein